MIEFTQALGAPGLGYIIFEAGGGKGPIAKFIPDDVIQKLKQASGLGDGDALFLSCDKEDLAARYAGAVRVELAHQLGLIEEGCFRFCWIVDYPMFERDEESGAIGFSHNPFSMPQGGLEALESKDPLDILAWQYDIVCNGVELSSGAIRNHRLDVMVKAFEIAGYENRKWRPVSARSTKLSSMAHRRMAASRRVSIALSCCWRTSPIFVKSSCSPSTRRRRT